MDKIIDGYKSYIVKSCRGYDSSLRAKGVTLYSIIQSIDSNTSMTEEEIHRRYNIFYNKAVLSLRGRKGGQSVIQWLDNSNSVILKMLYSYLSLCNSVYKTDRSLLDWYRNNFKDDYSDLTLLDENDIGSFVMLYNDILYSVSINATGNRFVNISTLGVNACDSMMHDKAVSFNLDYATTPHEEDDFIHHIQDLSIVCNNRNCPRWKETMTRAYDDGAKQVFCSSEDCDKCTFFSECNMLKPLDVLTLVKAIYYCVLTRKSSSSTHEDNEKIPYEHIPKPERVDDVVIYFGEGKKHKTLSEIGLVPISSMSGTDRIPESHASPREHFRSGGTRKEFTRVVNGKEQKVKATTFKPTVVNKGATKTSYVLKERKNEG